VIKEKDKLELFLEKIKVYGRLTNDINELVMISQLMDYDFMIFVANGGSNISFYLTNADKVTKFQIGFVFQDVALNEITVVCTDRSNYNDFEREMHHLFKRYGKRVSQRDNAVMITFSPYSERIATNMFSTIKTFL
jgi:hypothetical protein